jgi:hypothetical protein
MTLPNDSKELFTCNCENDSIKCLTQMFVNMVQLKRIEQGQCPARRPVFLRLHGVAFGTFEIVNGLPNELRVGIFGQKKSYPIWVRYSSDINDILHDLKSTVGIGIKLFNVEGEKLLPFDHSAPTSDFLMQNINKFFVNNAYEMCDFTKASLNKQSSNWLATHPETEKILNEMQIEISSVLETPLWSVIPFHFGENKYCKYKIEPESIPPGKDFDHNDPGYLKKDLEYRMKNGESRFRFMIQLQTNETEMPLDKAMIPWSEELSKPIHVATIFLPKQDITSRGQAEYGEALAFNPWRTLEAHKPVGSIAEVRKLVYQASANVRRNVNGQTLGEPEIPRSNKVWPNGFEIVRAEIHPGIGVARVGNSELNDGFFIGPEISTPLSTPPGATKDENGALKRQAARFRIYGYNSAGEVVAELTKNNADIEWKAHLANRKSQWYQFQCALDIPEAVDQKIPLRNANIVGSSRVSLAIDPGTRSIHANVNLNEKDIDPNKYKFNTGSFKGVPVDLGELKVDENGRLLVLGGYGNANSPEGKPIYDVDNPKSFINPDDWYDDISDGPVSANVYINGVKIPVDSSWVVVAPPNYAPDIIGWKTMYDLMVDVYTESGWMSFPEKVSFTKHILPCLQRLSSLQWVNKGFATLFGHGGQFDFNNPNFLSKLSYKPTSNDDPYGELRRIIYNNFRLPQVSQRILTSSLPPTSTIDDRRAWPWLYGDAFGSYSDSVPRNNLALSNVRNQLLKEWVAGNFENDWNPKQIPPHSLENLPLSEQPHMLDEAAMHFCLALAFHPGCEMGWIMRHPSLYRAPFRIRERPSDSQEPYYGNFITQQIALQAGGPLYDQIPGGLTRWMAVPWQADSSYCRSGYDSNYDPYLPSYWPARVPNQVLSIEDYKIVMDENIPREKRIEAFYRRSDWLRSIKGKPQNPFSIPEVMNNMVESFWKLGFVEARNGIPNDPDFPDVMFVETLHSESLSFKTEESTKEIVAIKVPIYYNIEQPSERNK